MLKQIRMIALLIALAAALIVPAARAETREAVISLEGMEEPVTERLHESAYGFSLWYVEDRLEAYDGERDNMEGTIVTGPVDTDYMVLEMITEEDAAEYTEDFDETIVEMAADRRVVMDVYRELENGRWLFLALVAENGQYLSAVGEYSEEAAEGTGKMLQRALESVSFGPAYPFRAEWVGEQVEDGMAYVRLTVDQPMQGMRLLRLDWSDVNGIGDVVCRPITVTDFGAVKAGDSWTVGFMFTGEMPENGIAYTDADGRERACALDISGEDGHLYFWDLDEYMH